MRHEAGDRFRVAVGAHEIVVDQPVAAGGGDAGPTPTELFVASLAACVGFYARRFLARHSLADGALAVSCSFAMSADHARVARIAVRVEVPGGVPANVRSALARVVEHCTVHNSIRQAPDVEITFSGE